MCVLAKSFVDEIFRPPNVDDFWRSGLDGVFFYADHYMRPDALWHRGYNGRRLYSMLSLLYLLVFVVSGFVVKGIDENFFKSMMRQQRLERWRDLAVLVGACCYLEFYYLFWLEFMIGVMLQDWPH